MELKLAYFYPTYMNLYGDGGNVQTLIKRCEWRGIKLSITEIGLGSTPSFTEFDMAFFGGGQDKEQLTISEDLNVTKGENLRAAIADGLVMLAVCGGFQLLGEYYRPSQGPILPGISVLDVRTEGGDRRFIGNIMTQVELTLDSTTVMVGFENHSGRTYLGSDCKAFGKVIYGHGNNGADRLEGARYRNCFGTYLHGPLLPKNPQFADYLISLALMRRYGSPAKLQDLDDFLETRTRQYIIKLIKKQYIFNFNKKVRFQNISK